MSQFFKYLFVFTGYFIRFSYFVSKNYNLYANFEFLLNNFQLYFLFNIQSISL